MTKLANGVRRMVKGSRLSDQDALLIFSVGGGAAAKNISPPGERARFRKKNWRDGCSASFSRDAATLRNRGRVHHRSND